MLRFSIHTLLTCLLLVFSAEALHAQSLNIRHYTVADGLPSSIIYRCAQDQRGFMWFGTESGISRFDGKNFRNFSTKDGLTETEILDIYCAASGELWLIPFGGNPMRFDPVTQVCYTSANNPELRKIIYKGILNITQINGKDIYFSYTNSTGLFRYSDGKVKEEVLNNTLYKSIKGLHPLPNGRIMLNIPNNDLSMDPKTGECYPVKGLTGTTIAFHGDTVFSFSEKGALYSHRMINERQMQLIDSVRIPAGVKRANHWGQYLYFCNASGGLDIYDHSLKKISSLLQDVVLNTSYMDRDGNLWLCSYTKGVYCIPRSRISVFNASSNLADDYVSSLLPMPGDKVLTGFLGGKIQEINISNGAIQTLVRNDKNDLSDRIRNITHSGKNAIVALSDKGLLIAPSADNAVFEEWKPYGNSGFGGKDLFEYKPGRFLIATTHTLIDADTEQRNPDTIFPGRTTTVGGGIGEEAWFSTITGVYYISKINSRQYEYIGDKDPLLTRRMNSIVQGRDGLVWMAGANAGVIVLKDNRVVAHISTAKGLASDLCRNLFIDEQQKKVWVATNNGVSSITYQWTKENLHYAVYNYNTSNGLPDNDIVKVSFYNGKVYAATANGLAVFPPAPTQENIPVHLVDILVEGKERTIVPEFPLRYFENDISIGFTGVCFNCSGKLDYQYRMLKGGSDTSWISTSAQLVSFSALHPGNYIFEVKTATGNSITRVVFHIRRPWYGTWWFWAICVAALFGVVVLFYQQRVKNIARQSAQAQQMAQLELQALRAQMNPHFLFNSLNAIQHFISENEGERAQNYLGSFSRLMRLFLESSRSNYISLAQEKELLSLYLELEQVRFNHRFQYSIDIAPDLNIGYEIPAMLIQPFAENAVNHGLFDKPGSDGRIWIRFYRDKGDLCCEVEDNGIGRKAASLLEKRKKHISRGMQITEERLKTLEQSDGLKTRILAEDKYDAGGNACGTKITIRITDPEIAQ